MFMGIVEKRVNVRGQGRVTGVLEKLESCQEGRVALMNIAKAMNGALMEKTE